jgi:pimeloyl-ACP methyl ester carboxylesterase
LFQEKRFDAGIVEINYVDGPPNGPPLVLFHSLGSRWQGFYSILPSLAMRWHVKALDFRGHGRSGRVPGGYRVKDYYADTLRFVEESLTEPAVLFGSSMGGWIAMMLAAKHPEKTRALLIGDSPLTLDYRDEISPRARPWKKYTSTYSNYSWTTCPKTPPTRGKSHERYSSNR